MGIETAALCLALAAYHESRGEPTSGQTAVMYVLLNRAQNTKNVCSELYKPKQFSFYWKCSISFHNSVATLYIYGV